MASNPDNSLKPDEHGGTSDPGAEPAKRGRKKDKPGRADNIYSDKYKKELREVYDQCVGAFEDKNTRADDVKRYWKVYNCELTPNQAYQGQAQMYLPIVHDAVEAKVQRFTNTLFPESGRYTEVISNVPNNIRAITGLLDHYVRRSDARSKCKPLLRNGEVEGQYSIYVEWVEETRYVTKKIEKHPDMGDGTYDPTDTFMDVEEDQEIKIGRPDFHLIADADLAISPPNFDNIQDTEIVCIKRWYTKAGVKAAVKKGLFDKEMAKALEKGMATQDPPNAKNPADEKLKGAGVEWHKNKPVACVFETWTKIKIEDKRQWCKVYFAGPDNVLGMFKNPNWNGRVPLITKARQKVDGSGWGKSPIDAVEQLQYAANDWANMAADSAQYTLCPIVMTDPEKNPMIATMVMNMAAIWQTSPNDTKFVEFQQLWKDANQYADWCRSQILQAYGINPAMVSLGTTSRKIPQAAIAQEQMVAIANITDEVMTLEDGIWTPLLQWYFELDQQHRDDAITIPIYGQMGIMAQMEEVPAFAWDDRYEITWRGSQMFRSQQQNQQMIAGMNILRSLPPVLPDGKRIELAPIIEVIVENIYGPRLGARVLQDVREQMTIPAEVENNLMMTGIQALVHPADNDVQHIQEHMQAAQQTGDPSGLIRMHIQMHQEAMAKKMQQMQAQQGGMPGSPGQPGIAGTPRPGAQPGQPRGGQNPAGAIHNDRMVDPGNMPRRAVAG